MSAQEAGCWRQKQADFCNYTHSNIQVITAGKYIVPLPDHLHITHWTGPKDGTADAANLPAQFLPLDAITPNHYKLTKLSLVKWKKMKMQMNET